MNNPADTLAALAPCPFCGGAARLCEPTCDKSTPYKASHRAFPVVRCNCGAEVAGRDWDQRGTSAIAAWNRRASLKGEAEPGFRDSVLSSARFRAACYKLVGIVEGVESQGRQWVSGGQRMKDTPEWCAFYVMVANMRNGTTPPDPQAVGEKMVPASKLREAHEARLYNVQAAMALVKMLAPGYRLIYRSAFRWLDAEGKVLSNHYDGMSAEQLAADFDYDLAADLGFAAIIRDPTPSPAPQGGGEAPGTSDWMAEVLRGAASHIEVRGQKQYVEHLRAIASYVERATPPAQQPGEVGQAIRRMDECRAGCDAGDPFYADAAAWDTIRAFLAPKEKGNG